MVANKEITRVGLIQMSCSPKPKENLDKAMSLLTQAVEKGAKVISLPELFATQYFCQKEEQRNFEFAETIPGPTTQALSAFAVQHKVVVIAPLFEKRGKGVYHNSAVVLGPDGKILSHYRKMHIPDDPLFYEKYYFAGGDLGFLAVATPVAKLGVLICWDQWFPEGARLTALKGADILFYPTAIGWISEDDKPTQIAQHEAWETMQRSHAIANGVFVVAVNRVGKEGEIQFWGSSFVADPIGRVIKRAYADKEEVLVVDCDLSLIEHTRQQWPFLRDRRVDAYEGLTARYLDK
ncbi:MAG: carbon-nitrogen hydrolase [Deltaproteobacteria bacterium]|nr:carbon-nitrogen hydrolase [Deltaproteobacteria bacterium]